MAKITKILLLFSSELNSTLMFVNLKGSVWSSLPPNSESSADITKPIILAIASMDSASFFRDKSLGADSPLSVSSS